MATKRTKRTKKPAARVSPRRVPLSVVQPDPNEEKSGCMYCPLMVFTEDFGDYEKQYQRNPDTYRKRLKEPHAIKSRNIHEPPGKVDVLFVGEAPGANEDNKGQPFQGRSGKMLKVTADAFCEDNGGLTYATTTVVRCRTPANRSPNKTEIQACGYELVREIEARQPKVIVTLGGTATKYVTAQSGLPNLQGNMLKAEGIGMPDIPVVPCFHPNYVLKFDHEADKFDDAIELACKIADGTHEAKDGLGEYYILDTPEAVEAMVDAFIEQGTPVAFDTETGSLSAHKTNGYPQLLCFSFTQDEGTGYTIPFDHIESPWGLPGEFPHVPPEPPEPKTEWRNKDKGERTTKWIVYEKWEETANRVMDQWESKINHVAALSVKRDRVAKAMQRLFDSGIQFVAQNEKFDRNHIRHAIGVRLPRNVIDTMTMHMTIEDRRGSHGLKTLAHNYTGMGGYEMPLERYIEEHPESDPKKGGSYALIPGDILFKYAGQDTDVTLRVFNSIGSGVQYRSEPKFSALAEDFFPRLSAALGDMEYDGAKIKLDVVDELKEEFTEEMEKALEDIKRLPEVRQYEADEIKKGRTGKRKADTFVFNPGSDAQLRVLLFDYYKLKPTEMTDKGFETLQARTARYIKDKDSSTTFRDVLVEAIEKQEWDLFSVKADVLQTYVKQGNDIAPCILEYRKYKKLLSTYIEPTYDRLDDDGLVHGTFLVHGTVTGRLASRDPNLQNIPYAAKPAYVSRFGDEGCLLQADYSQVELRVAACWYNEPTMVQAYLDDADLHTLTAIAISGLSEEEYYELDSKVQKEWRTRAKRINFGILYGGGPPALQKTLMKDGVELTVEECQDLIDVYFEKRPALKKGIELSEKLAQEQGYLESFTGRRRLLPEVFSQDRDIVSRALRQAINFPIQSSASDMTLMSLVLIQERLQREGLRSKLVLTVHDSIIFDCHVDELLYVAEMAKEIMENIVELSREILPDLDWDWLTVPIRADLEAGFGWGHLVEFDPTTFGDEEGEDDLYWKDDDGKLKFRAPVTEDELLESMLVKYDA